FGALALCDPWLAPGYRVAPPPLPERRTRLGFPHPLLLGCVHGNAGHALPRPRAVEDALPPRPRARARWPENVEVEGQCRRPARAHRPIWRRCAALLHGGDGKPGP